MFVFEIPKEGMKTV